MVTFEIKRPVSDQQVVTCDRRVFTIKINLLEKNATTTCFRECIRKWHKMYPEKELSQVQLDYLVDVIMTWIQKEMERG